MGDRVQPRVETHLTAVLEARGHQLLRGTAPAASPRQNFAFVVFPSEKKKHWTETFKQGIILFLWTFSMGKIILILGKGGH